MLVLIGPRICVSANAGVWIIYSTTVLSIKTADFYRSLQCMRHDQLNK